MPERWDLFCRVVDNYGDIGVAWRLSRQLSREHGKRVRLFVDDLTVLAKLRPEVDPYREVQLLEGVTISHLAPDDDDFEIADVVVETFGCDPPEAYVQAMAKLEVKPRWINLEYLSAEDWVEGSHALPSPHPRLPLVKHYFFPGFTAGTGGLLREQGLLERRDTFQSDAGVQAAFWMGLLGRAPPQGALKISLFSYAQAPIDALTRCCMTYPGPVWLVAPEGIAATLLEPWAHSRRDSIRRNTQSGGMRRELEAFVVPFLPQDHYDLLLWACDVNFVRGEDSFVRAQWARRPFAWNIYPTEDGAHWIKMAAFLARYTEGLDHAHAAAITSLWEAWNRPMGPADAGPEHHAKLAEAWAKFASRREALQTHARAWSEGLANRPDLASQLVYFVENLLK